MQHFVQYIIGFLSDKRDSRKYFYFLFPVLLIMLVVILKCSASFW